VPKKNKLLRISELASKAGVTPRTIRFYIQEGLLPQPVKTGKTMAYYPDDFVEKIRAIKYAQTKRFLPLIIIKRILEQSDFDYSVLSGGRARPTQRRTQSPTEPKQERQDRYPLDALMHQSNLTQRILKDMARKRWIHPLEEKGKQTVDEWEYEFLQMFLDLHENGVSWHEFATHFTAIQEVVEKGIQVEFRNLFKWIVTKPIKDIERIIELEEKTTGEFIKRMRKDSFWKAIQTYTSTADYAYLATADEGFVLPEDEIIRQLEDLQARLEIKHPDLREMVDLATGYSCIGALEHSVKILRRVIKLDPDNLDAQVRFIWYRRYAKRKFEQSKLESQLQDIVARNPGYAVGHAFLAAWYAFKILGMEKSKELLHCLNLCLNEISQAEKGRPRDLHDWVIIKYIKGRIYFTMPALGEYLPEKAQPFKEILNHKKEIDKYYQGRMPFFPKWLWPNVYYFYGSALLQQSRFKEAIKILGHGLNYNVSSPYSERLKKAISQAKKSIRERRRS